MGAVGGIAPTVSGKVLLMHSICPLSLKKCRIFKNQKKLHPRFENPNTTPGCCMKCVFLNFNLKGTLLSGVLWLSNSTQGVQGYRLGHNFCLV